MSRAGNFSSSEIWKLIKMGTREMNEDELKDHKKQFPKSRKRTTECINLFADGGLTYIEEKRMELRLGRSLTGRVKSKPTSWGNLLEPYAFSKIPGEFWEMVTDKRLSHPTIKHWTGIPDILTKENDLGFDDVGDIKNPFTLKSFCQLADCQDGQSGERLKEVSPEYYWQLVSNGILTNRNNATLFVHCPYKGELREIRKLALEDDDYSWLTYMDDEELPYLILGEHYNDLVKINFEIPQEDKEFLTHRVEEAVKLLLA